MNRELPPTTERADSSLKAASKRFHPARKAPA
jgi:hypothetical protein